MYEYDQILPVVDRIPETVPDVIRQQSELHEFLTAEAHRPDHVSGLAYFNFLYQMITEEVLKALDEGRFEHPKFLITLDVEFAKRYFAAIGAWIRDPDEAPRSWAVMFDRAFEKKISKIQFAVAGVNAHVNFDLAFSVVSTFAALGIEFDEEYRSDYRTINDIFRAKIPQLRDILQDEFWDKIDRLLGEVDDWFDDVLVFGAREWAWFNARRIWDDRGDSDDMASATRRLDRTAYLAGRGILLGGFR